MPYTKAAQPAACGLHVALKVVSSGPRCNKFVSRLFEIFELFYRLKYICHQNTPKLYLLVMVMVYCFI